ncbi:raftlin isoform X1 [Triplophysa rosa]|uniref:Raftlin n=1 Tax=Triplophysa rosa TaxID=992332 RepID=A0A9W7TLK8_TRIRA|nr:raftlin isoform X1 [Triplophysa rosa]XP_057211453.1 raftlin isoform X1 [Triplophysa rosa]XP_057211454.1 raftlin isoform X1 [Triplophysa rosa]KAI7798926.1 putative raftlin [Triplophysa rosa]
MGCKLSKPRGSDEAPGKIFSTLRRAQVETQCGVAYTYHYLDFLLGKEEVAVSSLLCLSSVRELPVQVCELYQKGFVLAAVHPFVHSGGPASANLQKQLHRAVLIRETHNSSDSSLLNCVGPHLATDVCYIGHQEPDPEVIQGYVKKVQDLADQGDLFVGFLPQPGGGPYFLGHLETDELSSLHSSPCSVDGRPLTISPASEQQQEDDANEDSRIQNLAKFDFDFPNQDLINQNLQMQDSESSQRWNNQNPFTENHQYLYELEHTRDEDLKNQVESKISFRAQEMHPVRGTKTESVLPNCNLAENQQPDHREQVRSQEKHSKRTGTTQMLNRVQVFALYNHTMVLSGSPKLFSLRVPLHVQREAGLVSSVDSHWLDHMTHHFRSGARLIDAYYHLGADAASSFTVESVFIFQSAPGDVTATAAYDAIVVEQWTVIDGVAVKTDYIPLLQSLAPYGWRLMCVLPTPVVKTKSDGSLATKQILFLQRPTLPRKRRELAKLSLRGQNKRNSNRKKTPETEIAPLATIEREMEKMERERTRDTPKTEKGQNLSKIPKRRDQPAKTQEYRIQMDNITYVNKDSIKIANSTNHQVKSMISCAKLKERRPVGTERALFSGVC